MVSFDSTDLDNATAESGVVHQSTANTDHNNASELKQGYDYANFSEITPTPISCYPLHEDSGTTAYDLAGANDATYNGLTLGQNSLLGTTAPSADGADDYIDPGTNFGLSTASDFTMSFWMNSTQTGTDGLPVGMYDGSDDIFFLGVSAAGTGGNLRFRIGHVGGNEIELIDVGPVVADGNWHLLTAVWDSSASEVEIYVDATLEVTASGTVDDPFDDTETMDFCRRSDNTDHYNGLVADIRFYGSALSGTQVQTLYDVVNTAGALTTGFKTV